MARISSHRVLVLPEPRRSRRVSLLVTGRWDADGQDDLMRVLALTGEHLAARGDVERFVIPIFSSAEVDEPKESVCRRLHRALQDLWTSRAGLRDRGIRFEVHGSLARMKDRGREAARIAHALEDITSMTAHVAVPRLRMTFGVDVDEEHLATALEVDARITLHAGGSNGPPLGALSSTPPHVLRCVLCKPWTALEPGDMDAAIDLAHRNAHETLGAGFGLDDILALRDAACIPHDGRPVELTLPVCGSRNAVDRAFGKAGEDREKSRTSGGSRLTLHLIEPQQVELLAITDYTAILAPGQPGPLFILPPWPLPTLANLRSCGAGCQGILSGLRAVLERPLRGSRSAFDGETRGFRARGGPRHRGKPLLSPAERDILALLVQSSLSIKEIAVHRARSYHTVRTQSELIYRKLEVRSRPELVMKLRGER